MYITLLIITGVLLTGYCCLILLYRQWFLRLPIYQPATVVFPNTFFSIIIPARNEAMQIGKCLQSIMEQNYPPHLFEVIVVNDHSTDGTAAVVESFQAKHPQISLINLQDHLAGKKLNAYKKKAIELAVIESKGQWIVTTDADCTIPPLWLQRFDQFIGENDPVFVAAPVMFTHQSTFLSIFQLLDFISLQGITAAAVSAGYYTMCNGANIAYRKDVFLEVGQFSGIDRLASGDDMLLMQKMKVAYPTRVQYLFCRESIVLTEPMKNWRNFLNQRIRWASKADGYRDKNIFWTLLLVYLVNLGLLTLLIGSIWIKGGSINWCLLMAAKTLIELSFMLPVADFYRQRKRLFWFPLLQPFHLVYTVLAGWLGKFGSYQWKGRNVQ
jgi:cellulose synthase/poly-beta-1,6-N-acetylglucosamine synthase-like glycosyltransferase